MAYIAGVKPSLLIEYRGGQFGIIVISEHHVGSLAEYLAVVSNLHLNPFDGHAYRPQFHLSLFCPVDCDDG